MSQRLKRILLIIGFVLSVFAFAFILYALFFRSAPPEATVEDTEEELTGVLPSSGEGGVRGDDDTTGEGVGLTEADTVARGGVTATTTLTTSEVTDTVINGNDVNYYDPTDGRFYTINEDGEVVAMSSTQFPEVETVVWNKDSEKALLEFPDGSNIIYDFETEDQVTLTSRPSQTKSLPKALDLIRITDGSSLQVMMVHKQKASPLLVKTKARWTSTGPQMTRWSRSQTPLNHAKVALIDAS